MSKKDDDREAVKRAFEKGKANKDWGDRPNKDSWIDKALTGEDEDDDDDDDGSIRRQGGSMSTPHWSTQVPPMPAVAPTADAITPEARAYWASVGRPLPSVWLVASLTMILGVFGVIVAYKEAEKAQRWGLDTTPFWAAWFAVWAVQSAVATVLWLVILARLRGVL